MNEATDQYYISKSGSKISEALIAKIDEIRDEDMTQTISGLAWMLQHNLLDIKVGIRFDPETGRVKKHNEAEFHSKLGIIDGVNNCPLSSVNETKKVGKLRILSYSELGRRKQQSCHHQTLMNYEF